MFGSYANPLFKNRIGSTYFGPGFYNSTRFSGQGPSQETTPCFSITVLFKNAFRLCTVTCYQGLFNEDSSPKTFPSIRFLLAFCFENTDYYQLPTQSRTGALTNTHTFSTNPLAQVNFVEQVPWLHEDSSPVFSPFRPLCLAVSCWLLVLLCANVRSLLLTVPACPGKGYILLHAPRLQKDSSPAPCPSVCSWCLVLLCDFVCLFSLDRARSPR